MSKKAMVTPEIIQLVREIKEDYPERFYWEIGQRVGVCDDTVMRILHNEYRIEGDKVVRIYKKPKKAAEENKPEQNLLHMYPTTSVPMSKKLLNALYGSNKAFSVTLNDICKSVGQIREALTDLSDTLK